MLFVSSHHKKIINPETKLTNVSIDEVKGQLNKVRRALDPTEEVDGVVIGRPISFEALENLRRFLRDRSYGLPAEGFDAIGQQQAGKLADAVEKIQREFSPGIEKFLTQYRKDSEPLNAFRTKLGESIVGKEEFDMGRERFWETFCLTLGVTIVTVVGIRSGEYLLTAITLAMVAVLVALDYYIKRRRHK